MAEQQVEQHLAVGGALAVAVVAIGDHCLQAPAQALIAADLAVVHEHPAAVAERMAVGARRGGAGGGAHVGEEQPGADLVGKVPEIGVVRSEEHTSELQSLMRISYAVFCLKKKK